MNVWPAILIIVCGRKSLSLIYYVKLSDCTVPELPGRL